MRKFTLLMAAVVIAVGAWGQAVYETFITGGIRYAITSLQPATVQVYKNSEASGAVSIPSQVLYPANNEIFTVTAIGSRAFYNSGLTSITIPSSVTTIGDMAFMDCSGLTSINIPSSVTYIGGNAFERCRGLTSVTIPSSVTSIEVMAFKSCNGLTSVTIPNSVTTIGNEAFYYCTSLTSVTIPSSVTAIGFKAFASCSNVTSISVDAANSTYSDLEGVLYDKSKQTILQCPAGKAGAFTIPSSVTAIRSYAFVDCSVLTSVTIPSSVTAIEDYTFLGCSGLTSVTIPSSVTSIGVHAFDRCSGLTSVTIPSSVTSIGISAFSGCSGLTSVAIPSSVTSIGQEVFYGCSGLTSVTIPSSVTSIAYRLFYKCSGLTSVTIPSTVTYIGGTAFYQCSSLTSVTIPSSVTLIGSSLFGYCHKLTTLVCKSTNPAIAKYYDTFSGFNKSNCTLVVPIGSKAAFLANTQWQGFKEIVEFDSIAGLSPDFRNSTLSNLYTPISCVAILDATAYQFRFVSTSSNVEYTDSTSTTDIIPGKLGIKFGETYMVSVRAKVNGAWGEYGEAYQITTPAAPLTRLGAQFHNKKFTTLDDLIVCIKVEGATLYLYQFIDEKTGTRFRHYNKGNSLRLADVTGLELGHSYQVTVLPRFYNSLSQFSVGARIYTPVE